WNSHALPAERLPEYTRRWAAQTFGDANATEIADITTTYLKYAGRRKPELIDTATYSLTNYREAERIVEDYHTLLARAERAKGALGAGAKHSAARRGDSAADTREWGGGGRRAASGAARGRGRRAASGGGGGAGGGARAARVQHLPARDALHEEEHTYKLQSRG